MLAEDLLLLLLDDVTGKRLVDATHLDYALAGSLLVDLALAQRIAVAGPDGADRPDGTQVRPGRLVVVEPAPLGDEILDEALTRLGNERTHKPQSMVPRMAKGLRERLLRRFAERGVLAEEHATVLGLFPSTRWPSRDAGREAQVRATVEAVLVDDQAPDDRTAALVSLLAAIDAVPKVLPQADRRRVKARAKEVAKGKWVGASVRSAVQAVDAAIAAAVATSTAAH